MDFATFIKKIPVCQSLFALQLTVDILHALSQDSFRISYLPMMLRVAVGSDDGSVTVFDIKTSAKLHVCFKYRGALQLKMILTSL